MPWTRPLPASPTASRSPISRTAPSRSSTTAAACRWTTHPEEKVSGVEVILTRLHAGAKFGTKNYQFSGGLHGVGVSVVNALSPKLDVEIRRNGLVYQMSFKDGKKASELKTIGKARSPTRAPRSGSGRMPRILKP